METRYIDQTNEQKDAAARDRCRVTGCATPNGQTTRQMRPADRNRYIVVDGSPVAGETRYQRVDRRRRGIRYSALQRVVGL